MTGPNWDDLRFVLAVARTGTFVGAARDLGVTHATVSRRMASLAERWGGRLFERAATGYVATEAGAQLVDLARRVEADMQAVDRRLSGRDERMGGVVRITSFSLVAELAAPALATFQRLHPGVEAQLSTSLDEASLSRGEADIALRATGAPQETLIGRCVARCEFAVYGARELGAPGVDLTAVPWIGWGDCFGRRRTANFLAEYAPQARFAAEVDTFALMQSMQRAGVGVGTLPCILGDSDPELRRYSPVIKGFGTDIWVLTHPELRSKVRVRALARHLTEALTAMAPAFEGRLSAARAG